MRARSVAWVKTDPLGVEFAEVALTRDRLAATGVAIGSKPVPYRLDYSLETRRGFVTARLRATARGQGWRRRLDLRRAPSGAWTIAASSEGDAPLPPPGGEVALLAEALDCDLGLSPMTNTPPVLRHGLRRGGDPVDIRAAWVSVPDLGVRLAAHRYSFVRRDGERSVIRFAEAGGGFSADLTFDEDGLVVDYPELARRIGG